MLNHEVESVHEFEFEELKKEIKNNPDKFAPLALKALRYFFEVTSTKEEFLKFLRKEFSKKTPFESL